jgi:hypothetical protein
MQDQASDTPCWCTRFPPLPLEQMPARADGGPGNCLCASCLRAWIAANSTPAAPDSKPD